MSKPNAKILILLVDDDEVDRLAVIRALKSMRDLHFVIEETASATSARQLLGQKKYDLVFLDYLLPDGDGMSLLRYCREQGNGVPVIVLTGHGDERLAADLMRAGAADYIPKSTITAQVLHASVQSALSRQRVEQDRKRAHHELEVKSERIEDILQSIKDAFFALDDQFRFTYINKRAEELLHLQAGEVHMKNVFSELADLAPWLAEALQTTHKEKRQQSCEGWYKSLAKWLEVHVYPGQDGLSVYLQDISQRKTQENELSHMARYDSLTDLPNRVMLHEKIEEAIAAGGGDGFAVLFCDLDGFKGVNDSLGHDAGDELLQIVARRLSSAVRVQDTVARVGGDEFIVLLDSVNRREDLDRIAGNIIQVIAQPIRVEQSQTGVTGSVGVSVYPQDGATAELLLKNADTAMYFAKHSGKNRFQYYSESLEESLTQRLSLAQALQQALDLGQLQLFYQPQIDIQRNRITSVEALLRWNHPQLGILPPDRFLNVAEESGLMQNIGDWVIMQATEDMKAWHDAGFTGIGVTVNLSPRQFFAPNLLDTLSNALQERQLPADMLTVEVVEDTILERSNRILDILQRLKKLGVSLCLDNFGTGYASLSLLATMPVDKVKIDRSFTRNLQNSARDAAMAKAIYTVGNSLNIQVIVQGIETVEQQWLVESFACANVQGFLYCHPMPVSELQDFFAEFTAAFTSRARSG